MIEFFSFPVLFHLQFSSNDLLTKRHNFSLYHNKLLLIVRPMSRDLYLIKERCVLLSGSMLRYYFTIPWGTSPPRFNHGFICLPLVPFTLIFSRHHRDPAKVRVHWSLTVPTIIPLLNSKLDVYISIIRRLVRAIISICMI